MSKNKGTLLTAFILLTLVLSFSYLSVRLIYLILTDHVLSDKIAALILLGAELFGLIHSWGYFLKVIRVVNSPNNISQLPPPELNSYPTVAIVVASYKEPLAILKETLVCLYNLTYPNKRLYLLDDSPYNTPWTSPESVEEYRQELEKLCKWIGVNVFRRKRRGAKAGIINDFLKFLQHEPLEDLQYLPSEMNQSDEMPKYLIVFDADMNPMPDFVEGLVAFMEQEPKAAFIQTPQYYSNFESNRVARAAGLQQIIFFEYIGEGKALDNMMFCSGTNVLLRTVALLSVGGFDETSVTEDFATSFDLQLKGWKSLYYNKVSAFGMGPCNLRAYFIQQGRWALGTLSMNKVLFRSFIHNYRKYPLVLWWEYFLSSTYYQIGMVTLVMMLFPILYLLFEIPSYFMDFQVYLSIYFPYMIASTVLMCWTLYTRSFLPVHLLQSVLIAMITFPIFIKAAFAAFTGWKGKFVPTPKASEWEGLTLTNLWPQILLMLLGVAAMVWGFERLYFDREHVFGLAGNIFWCFVNFILLTSIFYFNRPEEEMERE